MPSTPLLDWLPLWAVFLLSAAVFLLASEAGYRLTQLMQKRSPDKAESGVSALSGATLGLLAFLLAFVFSTAVSIATNRRQLVVSEANAIGTAYLRAGYLSEPISGESRNLLREYVDIRLLALDPSQLETALSRSEEIHNELWARAETVARENPSPLTSLYVSAINDVIDLHTERFVAVLVVRVPPAVMIILYLVGCLTMGMVGIHTGYLEKRNLAALIVLVFTLSLVFYLIFDLSRSQSGIIRVPQIALYELQRQLSVGP